MTNLFMCNYSKFMELALTEAKLALELGEFPVGCIIAYRGAVVASGKRRHSTGTVNEMDHAEIVALRNLYAARPDLDMKEVTVYSTMEPCLMCFSTLLVNGIRRFVYSYEDFMGGGTNLPLSSLSPLYKNIEPQIVKHILREKSLKLFKEFFSDPENVYLQTSLLARYTLNQELS